METCYRPCILFLERRRRRQCRGTAPKRFLKVIATRWGALLSRCGAETLGMSGMVKDKEWHSTELSMASYVVLYHDAMTAGGLRPMFYPRAKGTLAKCWMLAVDGLRG